MRHTIRATGILIALVALALPPVADAGTSKSERRVFKTRGNVTQISASAHRVALVQHLGFGSQCDRLVVCQPAKRKATRLPRTDACGSPVSTGQGVSDLVLLGNRRVAWVEYGGGNFREMVVKSLRLDRNDAKIKSHTDYLTHRVDSQWGYDGTYIDGLRGHPGSRNKKELLVWNTWDGCFFSPGEIGAECTPPAELIPAEADVVNWNQTIWKRAGARTASIVEGDAALSIVAAGDARIAVRSVPVQPGGPNVRPPTAVDESTLTMVATDGSVLSSFTLPAGTYYGAELTNTGFSLVVLRDDKLEVYNTVSGELTASYNAKRPRRPASQLYRLTSVRKGLASYVSGKRIHVLRLSDGASFSIRLRRPHGGVIDASLVASGLFYSHNVGPAKKREKNGRVTHLSRAALDARLAATS